MAEAIVIEGELFEDSAGAILGRIRTIAGADIKQADITSIDLIVQDKAIPGVTVNTTTLTTTDVIFDTIQTSTDNSLWDEDTTGFNFFYPTTLGQVPEGNKTMIFQFTVTLASTSSVPFKLMYEPKVKPTISD